MLEPKSPKFVREISGELPPEGYTLTPEDLARIEAAIEDANAQLSLRNQRLFSYLNSAPPARSKERLRNIERWRKEQRQKINEQRVDAAKIGTAKIGTAKIGTAKIGTAKIGTAKIGTAKIGTAKIGTAKIGEGPEKSVDQKQQEMSAHSENRKPVGRNPAGRKPACRKFADLEPGITAAEQEKKAEQENEAEQRMTAHRQELACQAEEAEKKFWDLLPDIALPPGMTFVPYPGSKLFTAPECLESPLEDAARRWFQGLCEVQEVDLLIAAALQKKRSWQEALKKAAAIHRRFRSAGSVWDTHVDLIQKATKAGFPLEMFFAEAAGEPAAGEPAAGDAPKVAGKCRRSRKSPEASAAPESSLDWLAAWAAAEIGEQYLHPLIAKSSPHATLEQMRQELTFEIWGEVLSLHAHRLAVPEFCRLPTAAAAAVRELYSSASADVDRLAPEAKRILHAVSAPAPDPLEAVIQAERAEHIWGHIRALPRRQRCCFELFLQGCSRQEMAEKMGCGPETVKELLSCARKRLRSKLAERVAPPS